jgi:hypothetical protein
VLSQIRSLSSTVISSARDAEILLRTHRVWDAGVNARQLRHVATINPSPVASQTATATQTMLLAMERKGANSDASESRRLAKAYMPSGKTKLQSVGT